MTAIGKVTVSNVGLYKTVKINQPTQTTIVSPRMDTKPNISLADLSDVSAANVQDGFGIIYNSNNSKYEVVRINIEDIQANNISGGTF